LRRGANLREGGESNIRLIKGAAYMREREREPDLIELVLTLKNEK
jgi:hypothetical protein